jgi:STE24 endopeptidase
MNATTLTALFLIFLTVDIVVRLVLSQRQITHVMSRRDNVPREFSDRISLKSHQRAADYTVQRTRLRMYEGLFDAGVLVVLTVGGGLAWLDSQLIQTVANDWLRNVVLIALVGLFLGLIHLPFTLYRQFRLESRFGFNRMTPKLFVADTLKGLLIAAILGLPLLGLILGLMDRAGSLWWLWAWVAWAIFNFVVMWAFPTWIAPLFNKFTPLEDEALRDRIQALAKRCNFAIQGLFVMDGSKRSAHGNAYFTGFGRARRIVFFDTLLNKLNPSEIEAVLAHELGHFKHKHIVKRLVMSLMSSLIFFALLGWLCQQAWFYEGLGIAAHANRSNNGMALLLFFLVLPIFTFLLTPLMSWMSRRDEFEADRFAAKQSQANDLISALVKLFNDNAATLTPDPWHSAFYDSHPPATRRIEALAQA